MKRLLVSLSVSMLILCSFVSYASQIGDLNRENKDEYEYNSVDDVTSDISPIEEEVTLNSPPTIIN